MRVGSMDPYRDEKGKSFSQYYLMAIVGAIFIGAIVLALWGLLGWVLKFLIKYWWIALLTLLIIIFLRRRRKK
jgi:hypothetical protein